MLRALALIAILLGGCGDSDPAGCPPPVDAGPSPDAAPLDPACAGAACGGAPTGRWRQVASCVRGSGDGRFFRCPEGQVEFGREVEIRGTWVIAADGTVTMTGSEHASGRAVLPLSCYGLSECAQLEALAETSLAGLQAACVDVGPLDEACAVIPETCACDVRLDVDDLSLTMTLTTDPAASTFTATLGNETITGVYCADGDQLWFDYDRFGGVHYTYRFEREPE